MTAMGSSSAGALPASKPRFGGIVPRAVGTSNGVMVAFAGKRWNPIFSLVRHVGRRSGRGYSTPVAARRVDGGFVISLAFGAQVDWYRNLVAAGGGTIRWRDREYRVGAPVPVNREVGLSTFNAIQAFFLRLARIDRYIRLADAAAA